MSEKTIRIAMNGVTGRMGTNQHLLRSICAIRDEGGVPTADHGRIVPEPILVGRNERKLARLAATAGVSEYSTDLDTVLSDDSIRIYFDSQQTHLRAPAVRKAVDAGKAVYCEKPTATEAGEALALARYAEKAGTANGVVQDKLWLPGLRKLKYLVDTGFFGTILSARGEFGYWVFDGFYQPVQRPSWNYRKEDGGGIIVDMFCHWRYVIDSILGNISRLVALGATHIPERVDEQGERYSCTAEDAAYAIMELENGAICQFNSSWAVRVRRDDLLTIQVDGTHGTAVAGLRDCWIQPEAATPKPVWNPDVDQPIDFYEDWEKIPTRDPFPNAFRAQWEEFLLHVAEGRPFPWTLREGAKGVQLAELGLMSWVEQRWVDVPPFAD